ncbi:MAG: hypothetical protein ACI86H_001083 [bacterium]|jgi:hypothetical protein
MESEQILEKADSFAEEMEEFSKKMTNTTTPKNSGRSNAEINEAFALGAKRIASDTVDTPLIIKIAREAVA